jgi:hypothetical protein
MDRTTLESQLFTWTGWDEGGPMDLMFYNIVLKVPVGDFSVGEKFEYADFDGETSVLSLGRDGKYYEFELNVSVGALIQVKNEGE